MTNAASAVTASGLAVEGVSPANFLRHNPKSADGKALLATEAPSTDARFPRRDHLPPERLARRARRALVRTAARSIASSSIASLQSLRCRNLRILHADIQDGLRCSLDTAPLVGVGNCKVALTDTRNVIGFVQPDRPKGDR
jgi:hypothetical protein